MRPATARGWRSSTAAGSASAPPRRSAAPRYRIAALVEADALVIEDWTGQPGPVAPLHVHHEDDEAWLVLEGALVVRVGEDAVRAGPGEADYASELL